MSQVYGRAPLTCSLIHFVTGMRASFFRFPRFFRLPRWDRVAKGLPWLDHTTMKEGIVAVAGRHVGSDRGDHHD